MVVAEMVEEMNMAQTHPRTGIRDTLLSYEGGQKKMNWRIYDVKMIKISFVSYCG